MEGIYNHFGVDQIVLILFFAVTLAVGIYVGRGVGSVKDYAVGNYSCSLPVVACTLFATMIGGSSTMGDSAQFFQDGLVYIIPTLGVPLAFFLAAKYIVPRFDDRFAGMISISDMVNYFYGRKAEVVSGCVGYVVCLGVLATQFTAMGLFIAFMLGINYQTAIYISCGIVVVYSAFGGIKSVAMTDVLQICIVLAMLPILVVVAVQNAGGLGSIFLSTDSGMSDKYIVLSHPKFWEYVIIGASTASPLLVFSPHVVQRYLMMQDMRKAGMITYAHSALSLILALCVLCIAFSALKLFPEIAPNSIIPTMIDELLPPFIKGLAICGMVAVLMSTADSSLHCAGILLVHNSLPKFIFRNELFKLSLIKWSTALTGCLAMLIALRNYNIITVVIFSVMLSISSMGVPLLFGLMRWGICKASFWVCNICAAFTFYIAHYLGCSSFISPILAMLAAFIAFGLTYIFVGASKTVVDRRPTGMKGHQDLSYLSDPQAVSRL